ncbi:MAG: hypothetical protein HYZ28_07335 [Myxococcales bacterium]|nr:hypothetical protein [Myxococcales bacterium]
MRLFAALFALIPAVALGQANLEGFGRVAPCAGWRLTPNDHFRAAASSLGLEVGRPSAGGPQLTGAFGYAASQWVEASIDLFAGGERLSVGGGTASSVTYGALVGARFQWPGAMGKQLVPYLGLHTGPVLIYVSSESGAAETLTQAWAGSAGATLRLGERYGICAEYRLLFARGEVPGVSSLNGGGHWVSVGLVVYFPPEGPFGMPK